MGIHGQYYCCKLCVAAHTPHIITHHCITRGGCAGRRQQCLVRHRSAGCIARTGRAGCCRVAHGRVGLARTAAHSSVGTHYRRYIQLTG